jgi:hypothetical protein
MHERVSKTTPNTQQQENSPPRELTQDPLSVEAHVLQLQRTIGNQATQRLLSSQPTTTTSSLPQLKMAISSSSTKIQRTPLEDLQRELDEAREARQADGLSKSAKKRLNAKIKKLEGEISDLESSAIPEPEVDPTPFATKYPALKGTYDESGIENLETTIGEPRLLELVKKFTGEDIKANITSLGLQKFNSLVSILSNIQVDTIINFITLPKVKSLLETFTAVQIKSYIDALTPQKFKDLVTNFDNATFKKLVDGITLTKVADLVGTFSATIVKSIYTQLDVDIIKDILGQFTAAAFNQYVVAVGGVNKFVELTKTRKLPATALKKYGAPFLKSFVGADDTTVNHLLTVYTRNDTGAISGGHDASIFYPELDRIIGSYRNDDDEEVNVYNGRVTYTDEFATYDVVGYKTHDSDGYNFGGGTKTLIHNLSTDKAKWKQRANEAAWSSIKAETFDKGGDEWSGVSSDGVYLKGYLANAGKRLATFYPY